MLHRNSKIVIAEPIPISKVFLSNKKIIIKGKHRI